MRLVRIGEGGEQLAERIKAVLLPDYVTIYVIGLADDGNDAFERWIAEYTKELTMKLKQDFEAEAGGQGKCLIIELADDFSDPFLRAAAAGCWEALRGIVHTLTLEKRADRIVLNLVRGRNIDIDRIMDAVLFLSDDKSNFCAGCTFDVRCWR